MKIYIRKCFLRASRCGFYATVVSAHAYFIRSEMRRNAVSCDALSCSQRYGRPHGNSTCSRNYMYAICTSHARKDRRKKSGEKAGRAETATGRQKGRVIKALYKDTQTEATAGTKCTGWRTTRRNKVEAWKSSSRSNYQYRANSERLRRDQGWLNVFI